jgi:ankyrin repeat protein
MAATGMGGGAAWFAPDRTERDRLMLETVTLAVELGIDVNAANTDGRTALDGARAAKSEDAVAFLVARGAQAGAPKRTP